MPIALIKISGSNIENYRHKIKEFLIEVKYGRYMKESTSQKNINHDIEVKKNFEKNPSHQLVVAVGDNDDILGVIGFQLSEWDSKIFKKRVVIIKTFATIEYSLYESYHIAEALIQHFERWVIFNRGEVIIAKIDTTYSSCIRVLSEKNYLHYETNLIQTLDLNEVSLAESLTSDKYRFADENDLDELKRIAGTNTFPLSHFYLDRRFKKKYVDNMYSKWIENSINSDDKILVIEHDSDIAGMFIYHLNEDSDLKHATWKFAAVDKKYRKRNYGNKIFDLAIQSCIKDGAKWIDTSLAIKNTISLRIHSRLNFMPVMSLYTFHKWIDYN
jgi:hypothetical protein